MSLAGLTFASGPVHTSSSPGPLRAARSAMATSSIAVSDRSSIVASQASSPEQHGRPHGQI